jgi:HSP20 family protein
LIRVNALTGFRQERVATSFLAKEKCIMSYRDWLPSIWGEQKEGEENPFIDLRKRIDSLFDDFDRGLPAMPGSFAVRSNVSETDKEICVTAEIPGVEQKDIDVSVSGSRITMKGEKKSEKEEKKEDEGRQFHRVERSSGSFMRTMTLPFEIDADTSRRTSRTAS